MNAHSDNFVTSSWWRSWEVPGRLNYFCWIFVFDLFVLFFYLVFLIIFLPVHGGGVGKYLADWICEGEAPYELSEFDPLRLSS